MDEDIISPLRVLSTLLSLIIGIVAWTYGFAYAALALLVPYLRPSVLASPLTLLVDYVLLPVKDLVEFVLSPVIYPLFWFLSWVPTIVAFVQQFKPLYTFFGTAAVIGLLTGTFLYLVARLIFSFLGWQDKPKPRTRSFLTGAPPMPPPSRRLPSDDDDGVETPRKPVHTPAAGSDGTTEQLEWFETEQQQMQWADDEGEDDVKAVIRKLARA